MKLKSVILEDIFIPEFNGNKDLDLKDQIKVHIKKHISNLQLGKYRINNMKADGSMSIIYDDAKIFGLHVGNIDNLGEIKNGIDLADSTNKWLYDLFIETRNHLLNEGEELPEGEK